MVINFCPTCGAKKEEGAKYCVSCGLDLELVNVGTVQEESSEEEQAEELRSTSRVRKLSEYSSVISYVANVCMLLSLVWIYVVARRIVTHGEYTIVPLIAPMVVLLLLLFISLFLYERYRGYALWGAIALSVIAFIPFIMLFIEYTRVFSNGLISSADRMGFVVLAILPLTLLSIIVLSQISFLVWTFMRSKIESTEHAQQAIEQ
ncbi:zinc ribbon domain-containing protein [Halalkalibacter sp. APA_J-10(15)]|uniref:zinc ribbon domain-containing protein n=1 Tax=Halalkalibacter sp. APA_J-10(15) TaxID=2933805 RepID=UPI001FF26D71|nr:zinc ribbon domain-containing protein [Halalkalibacter sp. APA_J-10(15)]MCK0470241.1 zinc ribbon domain-containing protein [Halalkalibacter sp. APA_J-10(15)]